jgi:uncharacterized spore protein YtfJ
MTEEPKPMQEDDDAELGDEELGLSDEELMMMMEDDEDFDEELDDMETAEERSIRVAQETMEYFLETADVNAVYAEPIEKGDTLIIPAAEVMAVMGFGVGSGYGQGAPEGEDENGEAQFTGGGGGGGGGGGRVFSRPVAVIVASPEGVRVEPVMDITKIALAAFTAGGFMLAMIARMMKRPSLKDVQSGDCC